MFKILLVACKKAITKRCHKPDPQRQDEWLKIVSGIVVLERLTDESDKTETERNGRAGPNSSISDKVRNEKLHGQV